jgi:ribosomal protein S18 acetylase RimI-like enzyme
MVVMKFREANEEDLPAVCALGEEVNSLHYQSEPHLFAAPGDPLRHAAHWRSTIAGAHAAGDSTTFVAEGEPGVVGFITVSIGTETHTLFQPIRFARVGTIGVAGEYRSQGLGSQLMSLAQAWGQNRGCAEIRLTVGSFNEEAIRWYRQLGYQARSITLVMPLP